MSKLAAVAVAAALLALLPTAAAAHDDAELRAWVAAWTERIVDEDISIETIDQWTSMARRHPGFFGRPAPRRAPTQRAAPAGVEQWRSLVAAYFRPGDVDTALRIMACESGGNPDAQHGNRSSGAAGLMQHLPRYWAARSAAAGFASASIFDPAANVATAAWLRDQPGGWLHWRACL